VAAGDFFAQESAASEHTALQQQRLRDSALKEYKQALEIDPHYLPAFRSIAGLYMAMKDYPHAVATYEKAIKEYPKEARLYLELGKIHGAQKAWGPSVQCLAKAVDLDPENRELVNALGWMQARAGKPDEALATFLRVNSEAEAHYRLALMLDHLKQSEDCKAHLRAAVEKDPQLAAAQALLDKLEGRSSAVQQATFSESAKPADADSAGLPGETLSPAPEAKSSGPVLLPPPPKTPVQYPTAPLPTPPTRPG
jgi:tetratricopeptide (TPR) repeat protein